MYHMINDIHPMDFEYILSYIESNYYNEVNMTGFKELGSGSFGTVVGYKNYAIKYGEDLNDGPILSSLQDIDIFPKIYLYGQYKEYDFMIMERLDISNPYEYYDRDIEVKYTAEEIFELCEDKGYMPYDLHEHNVVLADNELKIIDVGSFYKCNSFTSDYMNKLRVREINDLQKIIDHVKMPPIAI